MGALLRRPTSTRYSLEVTDTSRGGGVRLLLSPTFSFVWDGTAFSHTLTLPPSPPATSRGDGSGGGGGGSSSGGLRAIPLGGVLSLTVKLRAHEPGGTDTVHGRCVRMADVWDARYRVTSWGLGGVASLSDPPEEGGWGGAYVYTSTRNYLPLVGMLRVGVMRRGVGGEGAVQLRMLSYQITVTA